MSSQKEGIAASAALKRLVESTVRNAENILINLSKNGESIPKNTTKLTEPIDKKARTLLPGKIEPATRADTGTCTNPPAIMEKKYTVSQCRTLSVTSFESLPLLSSRSSYINYCNREKKSEPRQQRKAKIVAGSMRITNRTDTTGINVSFNVTVGEENADAINIPVCIECPKFQPKRICFNGEWRDIIDPQYFN